MTELQKLVQTWEKFKPTGTPHEHIWDAFIKDAKAAIQREKQALDLSDLVKSAELVASDEQGTPIIGEHGEKICNCAKP